MGGTRHVRQLVAIALTVLCLSADAQQVVEAPPRFVADVTLASADDFLALLQRAEQLLLQDSSLSGGQAEVSFVLHGPVLNNLLQANYLQNKELADTAASLSALQVIELKACRTGMGLHGISEDELLPFVEPVDFWGATLEEMVEEEGRLYF